MSDNPTKESVGHVINQIPDVWFDWYARLIPGVIVAVIYTVLMRGIEYAEGKLWGILLLGYLIGHILQPFSSWFVRNCFDYKNLYKSKLASKAYAECVGFVSTSVGSIITLIIFSCSRNHESNYCKTALIITTLIALFIVNVIFRGKALQRKIKDSIDSQNVERNL